MPGQTCELGADSQIEDLASLCRLPDICRSLNLQRPFQLRARRFQCVRVIHSIGQAGTGGAHIRVAGEGIPCFGDRLTATNANPRIHSSVSSITNTRSVSASYDLINEWFRQHEQRGQVNRVGIDGRVGGWRSGGDDVPFELLKDRSGARLSDPGHRRDHRHGWQTMPSVR